MESLGKIECIACGASELVRQRPYRSKTRHGKAIFEHSWLCRCGTCGLVQAAPRPSLAALEDYYAVDYRLGCCAGSDVADLSLFPTDNLFYYNRGQAASGLVAKHLTVAPRAVLDVGAGYGHILEALGRRYPNARRFGIEFSEVCVSHLRAIGVEVYRDPAESVIPALADRFDVVVLSHVLEHLLDPSRLLEVIREHLPTEGVFYIEVPNIPKDAFLRNPDHVWAPRFDEPHITFYAVETLRETLERAGFRLLVCETAGPLYRAIPGWRYRLPTMRWFIQGIIPKPVFHWLRRRGATEALRVRPQEPEFFEYGGDRIWIRALAQQAT